MGLIQKKDEREVVDGVEVIERSDVPNDLPEAECELVEGASAEDIAAEREGEPGSEEPSATEEVEQDAAEDAADAVEEQEESGNEAVEDEPAASKDEAAASDDAAADADDTAAASKKDGANRHQMYIAIAVIAVIVAAIGGFFMGSGGFGAKGAGTATLTEDQLDSAVATWTYNGATKSITAREAIESQYSLDAVKSTDGTYAAPSGEMVLAYARNQILVSEAENRGLSVSDEDLETYANDRLGTSDFAAIATQYGVSEDQAKQIVRENALIGQLYEQIVPDVSGATMPEAPAEPADGNEETLTKDYADYIITLLGKNWDSEKATWASEDNEYYDALKDSTFTAEGASYADAQTAYYVAYQLYAEEAQAANQAWTTFANELYAKANVNLFGLFV